MIRALWIFGLAAAIAALVVVLAEFPGAVTIDWLGYRLETAASIVAVMLAALLFVFYVFVRLVLWIAQGPKAWRAYFARQRNERGMGALAHGLAAAAGGDASEAGKAAQTAGRLVRDETLARILSLEAAQVAGHETEIEIHARALTENPHTELLGWKALFDLAKARGEKAKAHNHAETAFEKSAGAGWAAEALLADALSAHDFPRAMAVLDRAERGKGFIPERASDIRASILTAQGKRERETGEAQKALPPLRKAMALVPGFLPAAIQRSSLQFEAGRMKRAEDTVLEVWPRAPHPALADIYLKAGKGNEGAEGRLTALTKHNPTHVESRLLIAAEAIAEGRYTSARDALKNLLLAGRTGRVAALMAELSLKESNDRARADEWLKKGLMATRDNVWECETCGHTQTEWTAVCPRCDGVATQAWFTHRAHDEGALTPDGEEATTLVSPEDIVRIAPDAVSEDDETLPVPAPAAVAAEVAEVTSETTTPETVEEDEVSLAHQPDDPGPAPRGKRKEDASW